jgi:hypothetical protein
MVHWCNARNVTFVTAVVVLLEIEMITDERPVTCPAPVRQSPSAVHGRSAQPALPYRAAALILWPRLDRDRLRHCKDDPARIARLVEERTAASRDCIVSMLERAARSIIAQHEAPAPVTAHVAAGVTAHAAVRARPARRLHVNAPLVVTVPARDWPVILTTTPEPKAKIVAA